MDEPTENKQDSALKSRLAALDAQLQNQQKEGAQKGPVFGVAGLDAKALRASRIGTELMVAILAGVGLGWVLDKTFDTLPLFLLVFAFLGFGAGILNVWRLMNGHRDKVGLGK